VSDGEFIDYFISNYLKRFNVWELWYRKFLHGNASTNMLVVSFHNRLKTFYLERKPNKILDDLVHLLLEIERDDFMRRRKSIAFKESETGSLILLKRRIDMSEEWEFLIQMFSRLRSNTVSLCSRVIYGM